MNLSATLSRIEESAFESAAKFQAFLDEEREQYTTLNTQADEAQILAFVASA
jgi:hypothetical protein